MKLPTALGPKPFLIELLAAFELTLQAVGLVVPRRGWTKAEGFGVCVGRHCEAATQEHREHRPVPAKWLPASSAETPASQAGSVGGGSALDG